MKRMGRMALALVVTLLAAVPVVAQTDPRAEDVATPEAAILAAYESLRRAPGEDFDWDRFRSLHLPSAVLVPQAEQRGGVMEPMSVDGFIDWIDEYQAEVAPIGSPEDQGFVEEQIHMVKHRYGDVVQVMSTYVKHFPGDAEVFLGRGVNAFTLVFDGDRWWIASIAWDEENGAGPIPEQFLPTPP